MNKPFQIIKMKKSAIKTLGKYEPCDVCDKLCVHTRYCVGNQADSHFDTCSKKCADFGILQRI